MKAGSISSDSTPLPPPPQVCESLALMSRYRNLQEAGNSGHLLLSARLINESTLVQRGDSLPRTPGAGGGGAGSRLEPSPPKSWLSALNGTKLLANDQEFLIN